MTDTVMGLSPKAVISISFFASGLPLANMSLCQNWRDEGGGVVFNFCEWSRETFVKFVILINSSLQLLIFKVKYHQDQG